MPFVKGKSGNPAGRRPILRAVREAAQEKGAKCLEILYAIAVNKKAPQMARIAAAKELLDRGYGRPPPADEEGAAQLVVKIQRFAEQVADAATNMKVIEHDDPPSEA